MGEDTERRVGGILHLMHSMGRIRGKGRRTNPPYVHEGEDTEGREGGLLHLMNRRVRIQREG